MRMWLIVIVFFQIINFSSSERIFWKYLKGSKIGHNNGIIGSRYIFEFPNNPSGRVASTGLQISSDEILIFGGTSQTGSLNDLWIYSRKKNSWKWMKGSTETINEKGIYGHIGEWGDDDEEEENGPGGSRYRNIFFGLRKEEEIYMFSGKNDDCEGVQGLMNDVWQYNISSNQFRWVLGSKYSNSTGSYGEKGVYDDDYHPGGREGCGSVKISNEEVMVFGGYGQDSNVEPILANRGYLNDVWFYNIAKNQWKWMKGYSNKDSSKVGSYGSTYNDNNIPTGRFLGNSHPVKINKFEVLIFGGIGYSNSDQVTTGSLEDIWLYNISSNQWKHVSTGPLSTEKDNPVIIYANEYNSLNRPDGTCIKISGNIIEIYPTDNFENYVENLNPGDVLIVHEGSYVMTGRLSLSVKGTASLPVIIKGADGENRPLIHTTASQNTINVENGASYITIKHFVITSTIGDGFNMNGGPISYITIEDNIIHDIEVAVNFRTDCDHIVVRNNEIYNTGFTGGTGEGMYVGCNYATCVVSNSLIENNVIHDCHPTATQGDGIEIKVGSHSNILRNNVIYNMKYPGILVYGTEGNPRNLVEGNVIWNVLEGIQAISDAIVRNNIIFNCVYSGMTLSTHTQVSQFKDVTVVHNTLINNNIGIKINWGGSNHILANNAIYSPSDKAVEGGTSGATVKNNYVTGPMSGSSIDGVGFFAGNNIIDSFNNAANKDVWPKGVLLGNADPTLAAEAPYDFNENNRVAPFDVGAYNINGFSRNPGWIIKAASFKGESTFCYGSGDPDDDDDIDDDDDDVKKKNIVIAVTVTSISLFVVVFIVVMVIVIICVLKKKKQIDLKSSEEFYPLSNCQMEENVKSTSEMY